MSLLWERLEGNTDLFAFKVSFEKDPDPKPVGEKEQILSWGSFQIWVAGKNICLHQDGGATQGSVHWYLLPLLEWFVANWDPLFHEERLPCENRAPGAWESLSLTFVPPPARGEKEKSAWEADWYSWWSRHSILAARDGGLFPDVAFRRWRDQVEISWGQTRLAGMPSHFRFLMETGVYRVEPLSVVEPLYAVISHAADFLLSLEPESKRLQSLKTQVAALRQRRLHRNIRIALLANLSSGFEGCLKDWQGIQRLFRNATAQAKQAIFSSSEDSNIVQVGSCHAALMYGSASPQLSKKDRLGLAGVLISHYNTNGDPPQLRPYVQTQPLSTSPRRVWEQGYEMAGDLQCRLGERVGHRVDVEDIIRRMGVNLEEMALEDRSTRGIALAGPTHLPTILINTKNENNASNEGRRFTLAHELCHILHDRGYGQRLAICSGPWAPQDVERRAKAFAAMLLMPGDSVARVVKKSANPPDTPETIKLVAKTFETSISSTIEHLCNLGYYPESSRDALRTHLQYRSRD